MRALKPAKTAVAVMVLLAATRAAATGDRLAVLVIVEGEPDLSDNLTEVAISKIAQRRDRLLVGLREARESLSDIASAPGIGACVEQPACLARLGAATRADSALIGDVRRENGQFVVRLSLVNTRTAAREAEFNATVPADMKQLIAAIRTGVAFVLEPKIAIPVAPVTAGQTDPASGRVPQPPAPPPALRDSIIPPPSLVVSHEETLAPQSRWLGVAGYAAAGLSAVALSTGIVIGRDATAAPMGVTRAATERDLERREHEAMEANGLLIASGALAIAALTAFLWRWRHE